MTTAREVGLLALRITVGATLAAHGAQKLFGSFGGPGLAQTAESIDKMGFRPGKANALAAGLGEAAGGALIGFGLAIPAAGAAVTGTMIVAASTHAPNGFFLNKGGLEFPVVLGASAAALTLTGPGTLSLDHALGHHLNRTWMRTAALIATAPTAYSVISRRRRTLAAAAPPPVQADPGLVAGGT